MKSKRIAIHLLTLKALWRRKWATMSIAAMIALGVFAAIILHQLTIRQELARSQMIADTQIQCVVTDANGMNSDRLKMLSIYVDRLMGNRHDEGCYLDEYVDNVQAVATSSLVLPENYSLRRILNFASDDSLSILSGAKIDLNEGWTEDVFQTDNLVCLIPAGMEMDGSSSLTIQQDGHEPQGLTIIGTVYNGPENVIYCPFFMKWSDSVHIVFSVDQCSFSIRYNERLDECKAAIYETFAVPSMSAKNDGLTYGVLIQDEVYLETLAQIDANIDLLRLLLPILLLLCCCIGLFTSYLSTRGRIKEFAVMRCLGMTPAKVFFLVFEEFILLALCGGLVGFVCGYLFENTLQPAAIQNAILIVCVYLAGASIAVFRICNLNVMKLMKAEE